MVTFFTVVHGWRMTDHGRKLKLERFRLDELSWGQLGIETTFPRPYSLHCWRFKTRPQESLSTLVWPCLEKDVGLEDFLKTLSSELSYDPNLNPVLAYAKPCCGNLK